MRVSVYWNPTELQSRILETVNSLETRREICAVIGKYANRHVPKDTGALRDSLHVRADGIEWNADYAKYQYEGEVYGVNHWEVDENGNVEWWTDPNPTPTGRKLGTPGTLVDKDGHVIWTFGYTTPNTSDHWVTRMWDEDRRAVQNAITAMLKKRLDESG